RNRSPNQRGPNLLVQAMDQPVTGPARGFLTVNMRSGSIGREHVQVVDDSSAQAAMQVKARGDQAILPNHGASSRNPISIRILHVLYVHGSVHGQIEAIQREQGSDSMKKFSLQFLVGFPFDRPSGYSIGHQG